MAHDKKTRKMMIDKMVGKLVKEKIIIKKVNYKQGDSDDPDENGVELDMVVDIVPPCTDILSTDEDDE